VDFRIAMLSNWVMINALEILPVLILASYFLKRVFIALTEGLNLKQSDFSLYWVASSLIMRGDADILYNFSAFNRILENQTGSPFPMPWFYPPIYMLIVAPLSLIPFELSYAIWLLVPLMAFLALVYKIAPDKKVILWCLAFPSTLLNFDYGQNGILSAAIMGWGLLLLDERPVLSGVLLGILCYKPQLCVLVALALFALRKWQCLVSAFLTFILLSIMCTFVFGYEIWFKFFESMKSAFDVLGSAPGGLTVNLSRMVTPFAMTRLIMPTPAAYIIQAIIMVFSAAATYFIWLKFKSLQLKSSILVICTLVFTPYAFEYDYVVLALPLAWIYWEGYTKGWLKGEKVLLAIIWLSPLLVKTIYEHFDLQIYPVFLAMFLFLAIRRLLLVERSSYS
jgi:hypothetical protein